VVEFAIVMLVFFAFVFAIIDLARLMFLYNTLQESTRRAANSASVADASDGAAMDRIRRDAIFRTTSGGLVMMTELTDAAIRIDYLSVSRDPSGVYSMRTSTAASSSTPPANRHNCAVDPYAADCARLVRVRVCDPQTLETCESMKFTPSIAFFNVRVPLPTATTIVKMQSFGAGHH
jgi:Flp pilus assembly protein TadG